MASIDNRSRESERNRGSIQCPMISGAALLMLALVATACTSWGSLEPPSVTLANVELTEVTMFETTVNVALRIANPNPEPMTLEGASFKLRLEDFKVGRGLSSETVVIDRLDTALMNVTFRVNNAVLLLQLNAVFEQEAVNYGIQATLYTQGSWGTKKLQVRKEGSFDLTSSVEVDAEG